MKKTAFLTALMLLGALTVASAASLLPEVTAENWQARKNWKGVTNYKVENDTLIIERKVQDNGAGAFFTRPFAATAESRYLVSVELETAMTASGRYNILVGWIDNAGKYIKRETLFRDSKSTDGKFLAKSLTLTSPPGTVKADFGVVVHNCGTAKFRKLIFEERRVKSASADNFLPEITADNWKPAKSWSGYSEYDFKDGVFTITRPKTDNGAGAFFSESFPVKAGESYDVAAEIWVTTHKDGRYNVLIDWFDAQGKRLKERKVLFYLSSAGKEFRPYKATVTAPEGAVTAQMGLVVNRTGVAKFRGLSFGEAKKKVTAQ